MRSRLLLAGNTYRRCSVLCIVLILLAIPAAVGAEGDEPDLPLHEMPDAGTGEEAGSLMGIIPPFFIPNEGQADPEVLFTCDGGEYSTSYMKDGVFFSFPCGNGDKTGRYVIAQRFLGSNAGTVVERSDPLETRVSYFSGDAAGWHTNITAYGALAYRDIYPGIDLVFRGEPGAVKREFVVAPGADPSGIRITYEGAGQVRMAGDGGLAVRAGPGELLEEAPVCYQGTEGARNEIPCRFDVRDDGSVTFYVGPYDHSLPLVIDPALTYSGFVGGSGSDAAEAIAVDAAGNAYITGYTTGGGGVPFPVTVGPDTTYNEGGDAFVAKVNAAGTALVYCGYIGGSSFDYGYDIAVDTAGNAYITGETYSTEASFPVTVGPNLTHSGGRDAFVAKVNTAGSGLSYCGYIGGYGDDYGNGIAVDSSGNAYVTGTTGSTSASFPDTVGPDVIYNGGWDAFVAKVDAAGSALSYCGYIGGSNADSGADIGIDTEGNAYVTGNTQSSESQFFPATGGPDLTYNGGTYGDAFVTKVNTAGTALVYCGYIGGSSNDFGEGIAVGSSGNAFVTGYTSSSDSSFPVTGGPDLFYNGGEDAFAAKVSMNGHWLVYCGYIGGSGDDRGNSISVDTSGNAYITGITSSNEATFPVHVGPDTTFNGGNDAFVAKVNAEGTTLRYCGYIGGSSSDAGNGNAADASGNVYVTGESDSSEGSFPVAVGPSLVNHLGYTDAFVTKVGAAKCGIGLWRPSNVRWYLDHDNNGLSDYKVYWGASTDKPVTGDWDNDGRDEIGLWRPSTARWYLDYDNNGLSNYQVTWGASTDKPVTGDWDNDGYDEIGLWRPSTARWYLDYDNNGLSNYQVTWGASTDIPVTGDWDNDGYDEIGLWRPSTVRWYLDYDNNGLSDYRVYWGATTDIPLTGDWDDDGFDEIGLWRPSTARWYLDYDNNGASNYQVTWGATTDKPVTGMWN